MKLLRTFRRNGSNADDNATKSTTDKPSRNRKRRGHMKKVKSSPEMKEIDMVSGTDDSHSQISKISIDEELAALSIADESETSLTSEDFSDSYTNSFRRGLSTYFQGKANKSVLLGEDQMNDLIRSIAADYTEMLLDQDPTEHHGVQVHLNCASHVMEQFWDAQGKILQTKFATTTQEMLFLAIEDYIFPRLVDQMYPMEDLSPEITAMAISWICQLENDLKGWAPDLQLRQEWFKERQNLFDHYLERAVRHEMTIFLMELLKLHCDDDIRRDAEDKLVTGLPEQVTFIINQQLKVASERLPERFNQDVLLACNQELSTMISDVTLRISSEWATTSSAYFCAIINDTTRLSEYCEERHETILTRPDAIQAAHVVTRDIAELSLHATRYLCERIIHDLCEPEPILVLVGGPEWQNPNDHSPVERTIATFEDFLADIEEWLDQDYFFPKVLKNCLDLALQTYLESFFANTMSCGLKNPAIAAEELRQDYLRFVVYFNGDSFTDYHGRGGFYTQKAINDHWRVLQHMADVIDPSNRPENLSFEVQELVANFGATENGGPIILHLTGLRGRQKARDSVLWLKQIAAAKKNIAADGNSPPRLKCRLPDMRNSRMIRKHRPIPRTDVSRQISKGSRPFAESTSKLMQSPNPSSVSSQLTVLQYTAVEKMGKWSSIPSPLVANLYGHGANGSKLGEDSDENDSLGEGGTMAEI